MSPPPTTTATRLVAFIDIGTNSIRLLLVRIHPNHTTSVVTQHKQMVRLGEGEFANQHLQPEAMDRAVAVARQFASLARSHGATEILAVATAATREAANQRLFVQRLQHEANLDVRVVSGTEEARLIYLGVASGVHLGEQQALFIDIGGGSTELIIGTQQQYQYLNSLKLGAIRLAMRFPLVGQGPISSGQYARIQRYVQQHAGHALREMRTHPIDLALGSSGTIENLADIAARLFAKRRLQRDEILTHGHLKQVIKHLSELSLAERRKLPGLNPERADIIIAGAAILDTLMQELALPAIRVSDRGLRDGLLVDYLLKHGHAPFVEETSIRERSVVQLGRACHFDEDHAHTTARLALLLFDSAREAGLHRLGAWERELLDYAARLHRIGTLLTYNNYQVHTYYLMRNANLLGFDQTEIAIMATTALYHRKTLPRKDHPEFAALDKRAQKIVRILCVLLRLAESLDRSRANLVRHARLDAVTTTQAVLTVSAAHDCQVEVWGVQKHLTVFKKVFGHQLAIKVLQCEPESAESWAAEKPARPSDLAVAAPPTMPPHPS